MSSNLSKIKVGRVWGYPIVVTTGKSKHEAILLGCDDNPQEFLEQHVNVKIRWKVAGYNGNVPVSDVELQNIDTSYYRPRGSATASETPQQSEEEEPSIETEVPEDNMIKLLAESNDVDIVKENNTGSKDIRKPDGIISSGVAVKTEEAETDSDEDKKPLDVTSSADIKMENIETDNEDEKEQPSTAGGVKTEEVETDNEEDNRKPLDVKSSTDIKTEGVETDEENEIKPSAVTSSADIKAEVETDDEEIKKLPLDVKSSGAVKTEGIDTDDEDMKLPDVTSSANIKTEEAETDNEMDDRMPEAITSGVTAKMEDPYDTDDGEHEFSGGCLGIPKGDCNNISFFKYINRLSIRELLCWALQTETNVRLAKIERRLGSTTSEDYSYSKTLNSNFLIDIYPTDDGDGDSARLDSGVTPKGHDEYKYSRKAHSQLTFMENLTEGLSGLTQIEIEKKKRKKKRSFSGEEYGYGSNSDDDDKDEDEDKDDEEEDDDDDDMNIFSGRQMVPPTMLHFEIILEAFMGYSLSAGANNSFYNSPNSSLPRAAVMGGAVVAALTSYQDKTVVEAFDNSNIFNEEGNLQEDTIYWGEKIELIKKLHSHFIYKKSYFSRYLAHKDIPCSKYAKGDVDIFLQPSPLTQGLTKVFTTHGIGQEQIDMIGGFIGNVGLCENDLELFVSEVMGEDRIIKTPAKTQFAYAVSKRAVSFMLGSNDIYEEADLNETFWPRSSQFIMLDNQADLLGGLFDFDMSVVACSYDGLSVRVAPRAALSLMTKSNFVTPFCFEGKRRYVFVHDRYCNVVPVFSHFSDTLYTETYKEHRNKRRVIKYASRGFTPFLVDPQDNREKQKVEECDPKIKRKQFLPKRVKYYSEDQGTKNEIDRIQREKMKTADRTYCCHVVVSTQMSEEHSSTLDPIHLYRSSNNVKYTMKMFETTEGDAVNFYKDRFCWTEEDLNTVNQIDPYLRVACQRCKNEYNLIRVVMAKYPELMVE